MASFDTGTKEASNILNRTTSAVNNIRSGANKQSNWWSGYLSPTIGDPRKDSWAYNAPLSRFGQWWKGYEKAYSTLLGATKNYQTDWNTTFDENESWLDTGDIQNQWRDYLDRMKGYYGTGLEAARGEIDSANDMFAGYRDDWVDKDAYDLWGDLVKGGTQDTQDWFALTQQGQYLRDQANENFWRQAALGGRTYNPQEVEEFISNQIVAPEAQRGLGNLQAYAQMQPGLDYQVTQNQANLALASAELERWYAEAIATGDRYAQQEIADLMNQMNQQMWQSEMTQGLGDASLRYLMEGQMPATRTMDYTNQLLAHKDAKALMKLAGWNRDKQFQYLTQAGLPNAYDSFLWESGMYNQAMQNQLAMSMFGSLMGAL